MFIGCADNFLMPQYFKVKQVTKDSSIGYQLTQSLMILEQ